MSILLSIWTVLVLVIFLGIVAWAWADRNRKTFEQAGRIPLEEDREPAAEPTQEETDHG